MVKDHQIAIKFYLTERIFVIKPLDDNNFLDVMSEYVKTYKSQNKLLLANLKRNGNRY